MTTKRHFLIIASASRAARFFIKNALREGHDVTALCRAPSDAAAQERMEALLSETVLAEPINPACPNQGTLKALNRNIFSSKVYAELLNADPTIDCVGCFVGVTKIKDMRNPNGAIYTDTITALLEGMDASRSVEVLFHSSIGAEGVPGQSETKWPANANVFYNVVQRLFPIFNDLARSENTLAALAKKIGVDFIVFRPAALKDWPAKRQYGYSFDTTGLDKADLPLRHATRSIGREDVAEEVLRVASLSHSERTKWYGHAVYLVDIKKSYWATVKD